MLLATKCFKMKLNPRIQTYIVHAYIYVYTYIVHIHIKVYNGGYFIKKDTEALIKRLSVIFNHVVTF